MNDVETPAPVSAVDNWLASRDPAVLEDAVLELDPLVNKHLHQYGLGDDKLAKGQALVFAAKALKSYHPGAGASLATWVDRNMLPLSRFRRSRATPVRVPERTMLDSLKVERARLDFEEEFGRDPDLDELADRAGMSVSRIDAVRKGFRKMAPEGAFEGNLASGLTPDTLGEAMDIVWDEADKLDRRIIEMKTGYGGRHQPMPAGAVAAKLGLTPVALSRRSKRIAAKLEELSEALES